MINSSVLIIFSVFVGAIFGGLLSLPTIILIDYYFDNMLTVTFGFTWAGFAFYIASITGCFFGIFATLFQIEMH